MCIRDSGGSTGDASAAAANIRAADFETQGDVAASDLGASAVDKSLSEEADEELATGGEETWEGGEETGEDGEESAEETAEDKALDDLDFEPAPAQK